MTHTFENARTSFPELEKFLLELCPDFSLLKSGIDREMLDVTSALFRRSGSPDALYTVSPILTSEFTCGERHKTKVVKGYVQSRKTWAIISISLWYLLRYRKTVFILVRNCIDDYVQIRGRITGVIDYFFSQIGAETRKEIDDLFCYLDISRGRHASIEELHRSFTGVEPRIYVCMRNPTDLFTLNEMIVDVPGDFAIVIDEVDDIDNGHNADSQEQLDIMKTRAGSVWGVTATPMTSLMKEEIDRGNVFILTRPEWYKDIPNFYFQSLAQPPEYVRHVDVDMFDADPNLKDYIKDFSNTDPFECKIWGKLHPRISLIRAGSVVTPQLKVADYIGDTHPNITVVTYNGSSHGITIRGAGIDSTELLRVNQSYSQLITRKDKHPVHYFSGRHISEIIGLLESRGIDRHPRIIILAGKKADRGISFVSSSFADREEGLKWHLTELYLVAGKSTTQGNLLQIAGRLCGVFRDNIPLTIFSNVGEDIIKAYWIQDELIERAKKVHAEEASMKDLIPDIPISADKCADRRITAVGVGCSLMRVFNDTMDEGWDWKGEGKEYSGIEANFGDGERSTIAKQMLSEEEIKENRDFHRNIRNNFGPRCLNPEEFERITTKMFYRWTMSNSKIAKFMQNLDPRKIYARKELEDECEKHGIRFTDCYTRDLQVRTKYGNLFKLFNGTCQLYPELIPAYERYFGTRLR